MKSVAFVLIGILAWACLSGQPAIAGQLGFNVASLTTTDARSGGPEFVEPLRRVRLRNATLAPMAFIRFCLRYPRECKPAAAERIALTKDRKAQLARINREVNGAIRPVANVGGVLAERWDLSPRSGDCNDYAVTKRHQLMVEGWPAHALLLAEVALPGGQHHLVLIVRTEDNDDLLLDNLHPGLRTAAQAPYRWVRAQRPENPQFWSAVESPADERPGGGAS